jgi:diguanylate cyclase (GGDEF)-like protein
MGSEELLPLMIGSRHGAPLEVVQDGGPVPVPDAGDEEPPRLLLTGDRGTRPEGLERALIRAGFAVAESSLPGLGAIQPDIVLLTAFGEVDAAGGLDVLRHRLRAGVPVVLVLHEGQPGAIVRLLDGGAADVVCSPVALPELMARVGARVRAGRIAVAAAAQCDQAARLFDGFQEIAAAVRPEEVYHILVRQIGGTLALADCCCILAAPGQGEGRLMAALHDPKVRDLPVGLDGYPEVREAIRIGRLVTAGASAAVPLRQQGRPIGAIHLRGGDGMKLTPDRLRVVERLIEGAARALEAQQRRAAMTRRATGPGTTDPLTGCASLDQLDRRLVEEFDRARRYGLRFSLILLDVDGLTALNQRHGAEAGDRLLADLGAILQREIRGPDFVARYGGDEFAVVLPETTSDGAREMINRVRHRLERRADGDLLPPRLSAGIASFPHGSAVQPEDLLARAESALIGAKGAAEGDRVGVAA